MTDTAREIRRVPDVAAAFAELVLDSRPVSIALSGGSTAEECYRALAGRTPDWSNVDVFLGDDRFVPVTHPDSNEGMIRRELLAVAPPRAMHSMFAAGPDPESAAQAYDAALREHGPIDLVHLGLGPDGHTGSLFPGSPSLDVRDRLVIAAGDDLHPHPRITFTYPAIEMARLVVFTVAGDEKRDALAGVLAGDLALPASRVRAERVVWLVDAAALGE